MMTPSRRAARSAEARQPAGNASNWVVTAHLLPLPELMDNPISSMDCPVSRVTQKLRS